MCSSVSGTGAKLTIIIELTKFVPMKVVELLKIGGELLKKMSQNDVLRDDWRYVSLYEEYQTMRENGLKHVVAVRMLSDDYCISPRTVERIVKRLGRGC